MVLARSATARRRPSEPVRAPGSKCVVCSSPRRSSAACAFTDYAPVERAPATIERASPATAAAASDSDLAVESSLDQSDVVEAA